MSKFAQRGLAQSMARELHVRVCVRLCVLDPIRREVDDTTLSGTNFSFEFSHNSFWLAPFCLFVRAVFSLFGDDIYDLYGLAHIIVYDFCMDWLTKQTTITYYCSLKAFMSCG